MFPGNKTCLPSYIASRLHHLYHIEMIKWNHHSLKQPCHKCLLKLCCQATWYKVGQSPCTQHFRLQFCGYSILSLITPFCGTHINLDLSKSMVSGSLKFQTHLFEKMEYRIYIFIPQPSIWKQTFPLEDIIWHHFDDFNWSTEYWIFILLLWTCIFSLRQIFTNNAYNFNMWNNCFKNWDNLVFKYSVEKMFLDEHYSFYTLYGRNQTISL